MFLRKKQKARDVKMPADLTKAQQRQIKSVIDRARKDTGIPRTAQQSIPFQRS